ncbi:MAG: photosystem I reaction center subunit VIII [Rhizonema sp. NSF051]|nr:photosystem I reaction center subunit VIII [Rhizonema sp. NSF051]
MSASFLPSILVPCIGYLVPAVTFAFMLLYIERDDIA